ncbi:hypothetical protein O3297_28015, partial [Janthinobacterium sp. SUN128]|uniref:hypothetical protein n=1 Tax=Janthinobacterium sp. SUN128 TaxID=3014790 RepID=UPI0027131EC6
YFALLQAPSLLMGRSLKKLTGHYFRSAYFIISCEHLIYFKFDANPKIDAALTSNAHTYRLLIVKELYSVTAFALSTKRCVCQLRRRKSMKRLQHFVNLLFYPALLGICMRRSARGRIIALPRTPRKR